MERRLERRRKGSQEPASSDPDLMHTGCQFEEVGIERAVSSIESADATQPNLSHLEDKDSCGGINVEPEADKASGPGSSTDSSAPSKDWKSPLDVVDRDYTVAHRSDPWFPIPKWSRTTSTYAKRVAFKFAIRMFDGLFTSSAKISEGKPAPSEQTDSAYASMPGDASTQRPANWTRRSQDVHSDLEASLTSDAEIMTEVQTGCSDQSSVDANRFRDYIWELTRHLYQRTRPLLTADNVSSAVGLLPDLLSAFALQKGQESQAQVNQDIRCFVYKHRLTIAQSLRAFFETEQASKADPRLDTGVMSVAERMSLTWSNASQKSNSLAPESPSPILDADGDNELPQEFFQYQEAITAGPAFQWVVEELKRELNPSSSGLNIMEKISSDILIGLSKGQRISKGRTSKLSKLTLNVACDIFAYMQDQGYAMDADEVLPRAITLTGSSTNAQALTIRQYVCQTWPTIGCNLVQAIQAALCSSGAYGYDAPLQNCPLWIIDDVGTEVRVSIGEKMMNVEAVGTARSIALVGSQLGWLATTLSSSHREHVISFCHPEISGFSSHLREDGFDNTFVCRVNTETEHLRDNLPSVNGQCWYRLFNNPVVVTGYPIKPRRSFAVEAGLELPFDMMVTLSDCQFLTTWEGKTVVKGFSAMLIPTRVQDNIISWHLIVSEGGKRLSYADDQVPKGILIAPQTLSDSRHVLGWCAEAQNDIGAPGANYNIGWSGLPLAEKDVSWGPVTTSFGVGGFFKVSSDFERGNRERIISSYTDSHYGSLVRHIGQQHFLLWDVDEKRGWLTDGSRAHLHLVRASLWEDAREKPNSYYNDQITRLNELALLKEDAVGVLLAAENLDAETERRDPAYSSLNTRMQRIGSLMEKTIDQVHKATNSQSTSVGMPVHVLEGYDFMDVATLRDLHLHTLKLPGLESGDGWANLVPHLPVVTLFGKKFGELIRPGANNPTESCDKCGFVVSLPAGKHLLAVCVDVLEKILRIRGNKDSRPWQLVNELYWPTREPVFESCRCTSSDGRGNNDARIQMLLGKKPRGASFLTPIKLEQRGAVIFGHSLRLSFRPSRLFLSHGRVPSSNISSATQTTNQVPDVPVSATHDESFDTNENPLSDTVSSITPYTATWSKTAESVSNNTTIEQQNQAPVPVFAKTDTLAASPPQMMPTTPPKVTRKRSVRRVKEFCAMTWKKMKMIKQRHRN
ncbi:hypothetical protein V8C26DRAFT_52178 [Trichoderma gracile]